MTPNRRPPASSHRNQSLTQSGSLVVVLDEVDQSLPMKQEEVAVSNSEEACFDAPPNRRINFADESILSEVVNNEAAAVARSRCDSIGLNLKEQVIKTCDANTEQAVKIADRLVLIQNALKQKSFPPEFEALLDSLLNFCQKRQPDVLTTHRRHASFKKLNLSIDKAANIILPLFAQSLGPDSPVLQELAQQIRSVIYRPWLQLVTNYYSAKRIQRKREQKWAQKRALKIHNVCKVLD